MKTSTNPDAPSDKTIAALLEQYKCPTPFAAARAILMGTIASPILSVSPLATLETLWDGHMPAFESGDDAQALFDALINGLWNRLADHQSSRHPFRLVRAPVASTQPELGALALTRKQEIAGFVAGLFGNEEQLQLPEKAHQVLLTLAEVQSMFAASARLLADHSKPAPKQSLEEFARNAQKMTVIAESSINKVVQSCKRARAHHGEPMAATFTDRHAFHWEDDEPPFVESPLSPQLTRNGITVQVQICGDGKAGWILEVVDQQNNSHVWDDPFETDQLALSEAVRALEAGPMEFLPDSGGRPEVH